MEKVKCYYQIICDKIAKAVQLIDKKTMFAIVIFVLSLTIKLSFLVTHRYFAQDQVRDYLLISHHIRDLHRHIHF